MRVKVIINPAAGQAEPILSVLDDVFAEGGIEWDVALTHKTGDGTRETLTAADKGYDFIGVYGGDGTITEVASALAEGGPPMLVLPGGTGNALAEDLGIPPTLAEAAALVNSDASEVRRVDMGRSGDCWFVLRLTMGLEASMVAAATRQLKDRYGWLAYAFAGMQAISNAPMAMYTIEADGTTAECEGIAAIVANSAATGVAGARIANDVSVSDGFLDLVVLKNTDLPGLLGAAVASAREQPSSLLSHWRGREIHVQANPAQTVLADGEEAGSTPISVSIVPGAIGVVVPKQHPPA